MEKGGTLCTVGINISGAATMENGMKTPQKIKTRTTIWPSNIQVMKTKTLIRKAACSPMFNGILFSHKKERNLSIFNNVVEPGLLGELYARGNVRHRKTNAICFYLHVKSKKQVNKYNKTEIDSQIQRAN